MARIKIRQHDITDCGAACLASVAASYKLQLPLARIRQYAGTDRKGTSVMGLIEAAEKIGFSARGVRGSYESLSGIPLPAIAHVLVNGTLHHFVVIYKVRRKSVEIMDPNGGRLRRIPHEAFKKQWTGVLVLLMPQERFEREGGKVSPARRFRFLLEPHRAVLLQVLFGAVVYTVLGLSTSVFVQKIVDHVLPGGNRNLLNLMGIVMAALLLLQAFVNHVRAVLTLKTGQQIDARLIIGYYRHLLRLPQRFFDTMQVGEIISRVNDAVKIRVFINDVLVNFAVNIFVLFFSFGLMFTYYWKLALLMLTILPVYALIYYVFDRANRTTQRRLMEHSAGLEGQLVESLRAAGTVKRFRLEEFAGMGMETRSVRLLHTAYRSSVNFLRATNCSGSAASLFTVALLWAGAGLVLDRVITPGELLSFYALTGYFTGPAGSLIGMNRALQDALIAAGRLFEIMDLEREEDAAEPKAVLTTRMLGDIRFRKVHFRYGTRTTVFRGLDLHFARGQVTALVGRSGSGKTTLLSLLQHLYPVREGAITIGDFDIRYLDPGSLRRIVAVVPQQIDLFSGSLAQNIALGTFDPDMEKIIRICKLLGMDDLIQGLPAGLHTGIGENGAALSGGERQLLAIARALYREPEILIMDEATSSLDPVSEKRVREAVFSLRERGKTVLLIAHRLNTVAGADKIVVLERGLVLEEGAHEALMAKRGRYYEMWMRQAPPGFTG